MGFKLLPQTDMQKKARQLEFDLMNERPEYPVQQTAGLTPLQQQVQQYTQDSLSGQNDLYNLASGVYKDYLSNDYDPATGNYWKGYRAVAESQKANALKANRQRSNAGGMLQSTPGSQIEATTRQNYDNSELQMLGQLQENELNRRLSAAGTAQNVESQNLNNLASANNIGNAQRQVEQAQNDAIYNAAMQTLLHPYQYSAQLAQAITSEQMYYYKSPSGGGGLLGGGTSGDIQAGLAIASAFGL